MHTLHTIGGVAYAQREHTQALLEMATTIYHNKPVCIATSIVEPH